MTHQGFLVVSRFDWYLERFHQSPKTSHAPTVGLTNNEVHATYLGFDGEIWPEHESINDFKRVDGLALNTNQKEVLNYYHLVSKEKKYDLIYLECINDSLNKYIQNKNSLFLGYDFGVKIDHNHLTAFSCVYEEIIYGKYTELNKYNKKLNNQLLFSEFSDVKQYLIDRELLVKQKYDLESIDDISIYCIYKM